jgi:superfamily II DNA or RNA helicase
MPRRQDTSPVPEPNPIKPGSLRAHPWKRFLRGPDPALLEELYVPALGEALCYDRCCAYFSSTVLAAASRGFGRLIARLEAMGANAPCPAVRLIVNEEMAEEDVRAMTETGDLSRLEALLGHRLKNPTDLLEKKRLAMLGWLVKSGCLEVRVGVMRRGEGIVHAKFGIVTDEAGDALVFNGSGNESARGLIGNYERLELSTSWGDPDRHKEYTEEFSALWADRHPDVYTVTLPEALRLRLIKFAPKELPIVEPANAMARQKAAMLWRFIVESPYLPNGGPACDATAMVDLWPHQQRVVEETAEAWPEGRLLCDEVGMGKTLEAILVLRRLLAGRGVRRALILLPAALLKQWQAELREKGGMIFPRLEGSGTLVWPDERIEKVNGIEEALKRDLLLMSRETARTENNLPLILAAPPWDLVILDESHAARRRKQEEGEFNSGTLLLNLLRELQLRRRTRGGLLMSATPMQTHPWEPWDLLAVLGEGDVWLADFAGVRDFYTAAAEVRDGRCDLATARKAAALIAADPRFPPPPGEEGGQSDALRIAQRLAFVPPTKRQEMAQWLRCGSPLARRMHRNTRETLRRYFAMGLLPNRPPERSVRDIVFDFAEAAERRVYNRISQYIERRFRELEREKAGKGFVMTVYRRRASSSPLALERSLERRREGLQRIADRKAYDPDLAASDAPEALNVDELPEDETSPRISAALPDDPQVARNEIIEVERVLEELRDLRGVDTKRDRFFNILRQITEDGRSVLVFTEYADTLEYLRDNLVSYYGQSLGCYSGGGGQRWDGKAWKSVTKDAITQALQKGELHALICTDAASEGLNLQAAAALINYDLPWNPSKVEQRIGRIDRIGQKSTEVRIVNLFLQDSVDDKVYRALRSRCGLFEHFVGPMQPVLARARKMLLGQEEVDLRALDATVAEVERDPLPSEMYVQSAAAANEAGLAPVTRLQVEGALSRLKGEFGPRAGADKDRTKYHLSIPGQGKAAFSARVEVLERDRAVLPLSPLEPHLQDLAKGLTRAGERLPLVIASHQKGAFRGSVAYWVGGGEMSAIESMEVLERCVEEWGGDYPDPEQWLRVERLARAEAEKGVIFLDQRAKEREKAGLQRQVAAARLRLQCALGHYLACLGEGAADLNGLFHQQMTREIASAQRLRRCLEKFGGYPEWAPELCHELEKFAQGLTESQRKARLLGKELDAALDDPRWLAQGNG